MEDKNKQTSVTAAPNFATLCFNPFADKHHVAYRNKDKLSIAAKLITSTERAGKTNRQ